MEVAQEVHGQDSVTWRFTGMYGFPERDRCWESWQLLHMLSRRWSLHRRVNFSTCIGDFNDLLAHTEKWGRIPLPSNLLVGFRLVVEEESNLSEICIVDYQFTWKEETKLGGGDTGQGHGFPDWFSLFPTATVLNEEMVTPDHSAFILKLGGDHPRGDPEVPFWKCMGGWLDL